MRKKSNKDRKDCLCAPTTTCMGIKMPEGASRKKSRITLLKCLFTAVRPLPDSVVPIFGF